MQTLQSISRLFAGSTPKRAKPSRRYFVANANGEVREIVRKRKLFTVEIDGREYSNSHLCDLRQQLADMGWL